MNNSINDHLGDGEINDDQHYEPEVLREKGIKREEAENESWYGSEGHGEETQERSGGRSDSKELGEHKDKYQVEIWNTKMASLGSRLRLLSKRLIRTR